MRIRRLGKAVLRPVLLVLWWLAGLAPRDPSRWVFGSWYGRRFADNAKWLFLHAAADPARRSRIAWISSDRRVVRMLRDEGLPAHHGWSPRGIAACLRAGVCVFDCYTSDVNYWFTRGARLVNLWHGIPLKRIERDIESPVHFIARGTRGGAWQRLLFRVGFPWIANRFDLIPASSEHVAGLFASAFALPSADLPVTGFPRSDALLQPELIPGPWDREATGRIRALRERGLRVIAYLPTFRDRASREGGRELPVDWEALDAFLREREAVFLLKLHGNDRVRLPALAVFENVAEIPAEADLYPLLREVDVLVTDYSSVYFDFLLLDRPIVFFPYDLEEYRRDSREFYGDYDELTPGPKARNFPALLMALEGALAGTGADHAPRRAALRDEYHRHLDDCASERVCAEIERRFGAGAHSAANTDAGAQSSASGRSADTGEAGP